MTARVRCLMFMLVLSLAIQACSLTGGQQTAGSPSPDTMPAKARASATVVLSQVGPRGEKAATEASDEEVREVAPAPAVTALPTGTATATPTATSTPPIGPTLPPSSPETYEEEPIPDPAARQQVPKEIRVAERALLALGRLPGYAYTVTQRDSDFVLTGQVAGPGRRTWAVSEKGHPDHVIVRWVLIDGKAYSDQSGRWERIEKVPFHPQAPVSASESGDDIYAFQGLVNVQGQATVSRHRTVLGSHLAIRYDAEVDGSKENMWIAQEGGYLLRYVNPYSIINIKPVSQPPRIDVPKVGSLAFGGAPPAWRASIVGAQRLQELESYSFEVQTPESEGIYASVPRSDVRGRISAETGQVSGRGFGTQGERSGTMLRGTLVYVGNKLWVRVGRGQWHEASAALRAYDASGNLPWSDDGGVLLEGEVLNLLQAVPTGLPPQFDAPPRPDGASPWDTYAGTTYGLEVPSPWLATVHWPLSDGRLIGMETVNGVSALHYRGQVTASLVEGYDPYGRQPEVQVDTWLAAEDYHLVRFRLRVKRNRELRLDIFDANQPVRVLPPTP